MDFRFDSSLSLSPTSIVAFVLLALFSAPALQAEQLRPQIEIQAYIDQSLYDIFKEDAASLIDDSLAYTQINIRKALGIEAILAPTISATLKETKFNSGLDEMNAFAQSLDESGSFGNADIHVLFSMPRANSWAFGMSYQNSICSAEQKNILIVRLSSPAFTALTLTHEIGHMLGAQHESETNNLMNPLFGIPWPEYFSELGVTAITQHLNNVGQCLLWNTGNTQTIRAIKIATNRLKLVWKRSKGKSDCELKSYKLNKTSGIASKLTRVHMISPKAKQKLVKTYRSFKKAPSAVVWSLSCDTSEQRSNRL
jgi:hypothetical protein